MRNSSIDFLKFLLAYEVVMLHCSQEPTSLVRPVVDSAVPCFFMISGFYIYDSDTLRYENKLKKNIRKIFIVLCWASLVCSFNDFYRLFFFHDLGTFSWKSLWIFLFFNENPFAFHLWYISAYLYVLLFFWLLNKYGARVKAERIMILWLSGVVLALLYSLSLGKNIEYYYIRNFFFEGIPFFGVGLLLSQKVRWVKKTPLWGVVLTLVGVVFLAIFEKSQENYNNGTFFFSGIIAFVTLILFLKIRMHKPNYLTKIGKEDGLYIYIFHPFIMNLLKSKFLISTFGYNPYFFSTAVFVLTVCGIRLFSIIKKNCVYIRN